LVKWMISTSIDVFGFLVKYKVDAMITSLYPRRNGECDCPWRKMEAITAVVAILILTIERR